MAEKPKPDGYQSVIPYLIVDGAAKAIEYYKKALGATELMRYDAPGGKVGHAELKIGDCVVMLADEHPEMGFKGPRTIGGTPVCLVVYVENVDAQFAKATAAGAQVLRPLQDQFYGDRSGTIADPFGHVWTLSTHKEDLAPEEIQKREAAMKAEGKTCG
jgi:PhnB protein